MCMHNEVWGLTDIFSENFLHIYVFEESDNTKIWGDQAVQRRTSEVFGSERP